MLLPPASNHPLPDLDTILIDYPRLPADIQNTYAVVLAAEQAAADDLNNISLSSLETNNYTVNLICARIVGYLILKPLNEVARDFVLDEVRVRRKKYGRSLEALNDSIYTLGLYYLNYFIRPFTRKPEPEDDSSTNSPDASNSSHHRHKESPPCRSFSTRREYVKTFISGYHDPPTDIIQAKEAALIRDGYRCMVTRNYDSHSIDMIKEVDEEFRADKKFKFPIRAHCRQIIPEPEERVKFGNTSNAGLWSILSNFGEPNLADEIMDRGAYHLSNVLTLETKFHDAFMRLELTFKKTDPSDPNDHCYSTALSRNLEQTFALRGISYPKQIRFTNHTPNSLKLPLPDPRYLRIHAVCAKIAQLSGAARYLDQTRRDIETTPTLANDGSSVTVLYNALLSHAGSCTY